MKELFSYRRRARSLRCLVVVSAILLVFPFSSNLLFARGAGEASGTITVVGEGAVTAEPDQATLRVGAELYDRNAEAAAAELNRRMERVISAIIATGVPREQIRTTNYSLLFEREYRGGDRPQSSGAPASESTPDGRYRIQNIVEVVIDEVERAPSVVEAAIDAGANQMHGLSFSFSDPRSLESEARSEAMRNAFARAQELAATADSSVGEVVEITQLVGSAPSPQPRLAYTEGIGGGGSVEPGRSRYTARVQVTYRLER